MKINWFDCDLKIYDSVGFEVGSILDLPLKARREIVNAILEGHTCGSYTGEVLDNELLGELHPVYVDQLKSVAYMQRSANMIRDLEAAQRAQVSSLQHELGHVQEEQNDDE